MLRVLLFSTLVKVSPNKYIMFGLNCYSVRIDTLNMGNKAKE